MRPLLTSICPDLRNGTPVILAFCDACGTVKVFNERSSRYPFSLRPFPDSGLWTECRACDEYRFFFRIKDGLVVSVGKGKYGKNHQTLDTAS